MPHWSLPAMLVAGAVLVGCTAEGHGGPPRYPPVEPGRSVAGVRLGATAAQVRQVLGRPDAVRPSELHGAWRRFVYRSRRLRVTIEDRGRVWNIRSLSPADRTAGGLGVGSTERQLRDGLPRLRCRAWGGSGARRTWRVCADDRSPVRPFTEFTLIHDRVVMVTVARGLAV